MKTLHKSKSNQILAGVCGGIAEYLDADPTVVRLGYVLFSLIFGCGILAYIIAAIVMPSEGDC